MQTQRSKPQKAMHQTHGFLMDDDPIPPPLLWMLVSAGRDSDRRIGAADDQVSDASRCLPAAITSGSTRPALSSARRSAEVNFK